MVTTPLMEQLFQTVQAIGVTKTHEALQVAENRGLTFANVQVERVVKTVIRIFGMPIHEIHYGTGRKNERIWAIGFCVYYLTKSFGFTVVEVAEHINKDKTGCFRYVAMVEKLNAKVVAPAFAQYAKYKEALDIEFPLLPPPVKSSHGK